MNTYKEAHSELNPLEARIDARRVFFAVLTVALLAAVAGLAVLGLDALNDLMARGFTSLSNPNG
jgi:hypothetical protein